ncbi:MAG: DUF493 domain-containing protein [Sutterellaceae bacterium]|nr:DUF493 domain-containing protein [Sutterellaceae bacterium]MDD7442579.1 DUF493 domain-containing protein [Sutterellaceae bacterium]MDY2867223.1 DUF493 domain-containing protein [Mesosutterella sp.]
MENSEENKLLKFPCLLPIKVIGNAREGLLDDIHDCVLSLTPGFERESLESRLSSNGNYQAVTVRITAESQEHLDNVYIALRRVTGVKFIL